MYDANFIIEFLQRNVLRRTQASAHAQPLCSGEKTRAAKNLCVCNVVVSRQQVSSPSSRVAVRFSVSPQS